MGMYDSIEFRYRMPNGKTENDYQTKDLECRCDFYTITPGGRLLLEQDDGELADTGFDGMLVMTASDGYQLHFEQGTLKWIGVYSQGDKLWPFVPEGYLTDQG